jgi:DNA-binding NarL/FixJ family response regulator
MLADDEKTEEIKVLIVDDHTLFAEGTAALLSSESNLKIVGIANDGRRCLALLKSITPDIILLDISLPDISGISLIDEIKSMNPEVKIIMLTGLNPMGYLTKSLRKGVHGFLLKECNKKEIIETIFHVAQGKDYFSQGLAPYLKSAIIGKEIGLEVTSEPVKTTDTKLTPKEKEIIELIAMGLRTREVATKLGVKNRTIDFHVSNILMKFGVKTRYEAVLTYTKSKDGKESEIGF